MVLKVVVIRKKVLSVSDKEKSSASQDKFDRLGEILINGFQNMNTAMESVGDKLQIKSVLKWQRRMM